MKKTFTSFIILLVVLCSANSIFAQEKIAQTGFQFLSVISDAKAAAMCGALTAVPSKSSSLFFNPGSMGFDTNLVDLSFSLNQWMADINHQNFSVSFRPADGDYGTFGLSLQLVDYGEILGTVVSNSEKGYEDIGNLSASALAVGAGYSKMLSDRFSVGGQIKYIRQDLGTSTIVTSREQVTKDSVVYSTNEATNKLSVIAFDFGTLFYTGYKSLAFGVSVRNFSPEIKYASEAFSLPLSFSLGISMNLIDLTEYSSDTHTLLFSIDAINNRSAPGKVGFGLDYKFMNMFALRGGYISDNDENSYSVGVGLNLYGLAVDYAYSPYGVLGDINRFSVRFAY